MTPARDMMNRIDAEDHYRISFDLISTTARLLFANGQTTRRTDDTVIRLANHLGLPVTLFPRWGELIVRVDGENSRNELIPVIPGAMDMGKVFAAMDVVHRVCEGHLDAVTARKALAVIDKSPPISLLRFASFAAAGAVALAIIFGASHWLSLMLIAFSAASGACLRRWLSHHSHNLLVQPFCAALLAGIIGTIALHFNAGSVLQLVAVCPCMILVPGPHFLNGALDLARANIPLGLARLAFASLITLMISMGLILGLALGDNTIPAAGPIDAIPLLDYILAAGVAVAAYGTFFSMPWRILPIPILVGMLAHASRWSVMTLGGASIVTGAFVACLIVGILMTFLADWLRLPFAGVAFACVVSLIPGVFLFRMAGGLTDLVTLGGNAPQNLFIQVASDGATALLIILAMAFGLILPKLCIDHFLWPAPPKLLL